MSILNHPLLAQLSGCSSIAEHMCSYNKELVAQVPGRVAEEGPVGGQSHGQPQVGLP